MIKQFLEFNKKGPKKGGSGSNSSGGSGSSGGSDGGLGQRPTIKSSNKTPTKKG